MLKIHPLVLAMASAGLVYGGVANAAESAEKSVKVQQEIKEEHVLVTVPVHRQSNQNAIPVTVISDETLRDKSGATIGETLASFAGINNASFGPAVGRPVIRGQQGARVTVLQNSTSVADASNVSPDHAVVSEAILAEGIEVLRGPSTLLYGGGAIGGVVNILDRRIPQERQTRPQGRMEVRHGSVNDETTVVGKISTGIDNFAFYLDGLKRSTNNVQIPGFAIRENEEEHEEGHEEGHEEHEENTNGYVANSATETQSFTLGTSYIFDQGYLGFAVNHLENDYGIPPGAHVHAEHEEEEEGEHEEHEEHEASINIEMERTRYDVRGDWHDVFTNIEHIRWYLTHTEYEHKEIESGGEEAAEAEDHGTRFEKRSTENRLEIVHKNIAGWHGAVGVQANVEDFSAIGEESFIPPVKEKSFGVFLLEDFHSSIGLYQVGMRLDRDQLELEQNLGQESFTNLSLALSGLWELNSVFNLGVALSSAERAPTVEELFSNIGNDQGSYVVHGATQAIEVGNSALDAERSQNVDVSLSWSQANTEGFLTLFYNDFADYIYLRNTNTAQDDFNVYAFTQQDATFHGAEVELKHYWQRHEAKIFGDVIRGRLASDEDIPRMPPARVGAEWAYQYSRVTSRVTVLHAFEQRRAGTDEAPTDAYTRVDLALEYALNDSADSLLFAKVKNASDEDIRESTSFLRDIAPSAGRSLEAGLRLSF
ncbi:putative TonB-dependent receptor [Thalassocella blandensis]|nr:putative TonB-dependent receptor [Thalassocella blandensis]